ncbi:hypothetical protein [Candidatus Trichorickettsia mobilis]|nr:hypothetical protein [Candidatus Trichorickettsia mobilis]
MKIARCHHPEPELVLKIFASNKVKKISLDILKQDFIRHLTADFIDKFFALDKIVNCGLHHFIAVIKKTNNTDTIKKVLYSLKPWDSSVYTIVTQIIDKHPNLALEYLQRAPIVTLDDMQDMISCYNSEFIYKVIDITAAHCSYSILENCFQYNVISLSPTQRNNNHLKKLITVKNLDGLPLININEYQAKLWDKYSADPEMMQYLREHGFRHNKQEITKETVEKVKEVVKAKEIVTNPQSAHTRSVEEEKQLAKLKQQFPDLNIEQAISEIGACINELKTNANAPKQSITFDGDSIAVGIRTVDSSKTVTTTLKIADALTLANRAFDGLVAAVHLGTPDATKILALVWQKLHQQEVASKKPYYYTSDLIKALAQIACEYVKVGQEIEFNASCVGGSLNILLDLSKTHELLTSSTNQPQIPRINKVDFSQYIIEEVMPNFDQGLLKVILDRIAKSDNTDGMEWRYEQALRAILNQSLYKFKLLQFGEAHRVPDDEDFIIVAELLPTIPQIYASSTVEETTVGIERLKNSICNSFKQIFKLEATHQAEITKNTVAHLTERLKTLISKFMNDTSEPSQIVKEVSKYLTDHEVNLDDFNKYGLNLVEQVEAFFTSLYAANDPSGLIGGTMTYDLES